MYEEYESSQATADGEENALKKTISYLIIQASYAYVALSRQMGSAETISLEEEEEEEEPELLTNMPEWLREEEKPAEEKKEERIIRIIDKGAYQDFKESFEHLWILTKDQVSDEHWATTTLDEEVHAYFDRASKSRHDPRQLRRLFREYLTTLKRCGLNKL